MKQTELYQMLAFLLRYPNEEFRQILLGLTAEIQEVGDTRIRQKLFQFIELVEQTPLDDWINHYVSQFDFDRKTNLYVTYFKNGEQKERGLELLKLKKFYQTAGFDIVETELPDYIPLMLEFSAQVSADIRQELWKMHEQAIWEIRETLLSIKSFYGLLFDVLIQLFEQDGLEHHLTAEKQTPIPNLEDQAILAKMRDQLIKNQLG